MEWISEIIEEYVKQNQIKTTAENMEKLKEYYIMQGYCFSLYVVCNALIADSETVRILSNGID